MTVLLLCLQIFFFRIIDVSMGVTRTIMLVKRKTLLAALIGFVEVLIWFLIVRNALNYASTSIFIALAYALGFATGTLIGGFLSRRFIHTKINVQVITSMRDEKITKAIRGAGFPITILDAFGSGDDKAPRYLLFIEMNSNDFNKLKNLVLSLDPRAFIFVNELTNSVNGFFFEKK